MVDQRWGVGTDDDDNARRFQVHRNWLVSFRDWVNLVYGHDGSPSAGIVAEHRELPRVRGINRREPHDPDRLARFLTISWAAELQLRLAAMTEETLRYATSWTPIQAYYSVYMAAHAWFAASGQNVTNHTATINTLSQRVQSGWFVSPWSGYCRGCVELDEETYGGLDELRPLEAHVELLATPDFTDFGPRFARLLASTRDHHFVARKDEARRRLRRRNLTRQMKRDADANLNATTVFDYLLRLRERLTYRDVSAFMLPDAPDWWYTAFHGGLVALTDWTNLQLHSLVVASVGPDRYGELAADFRRRAGPQAADALTFVGERVELLA